MTRRRRSPIAAAALAFSLAPGICRAASSVLGAEGLQAQQIERAWWLFLAVCALVYLIVLAGLAYALLHRRRRAMHGPALPIELHRESRTDLALAAWVGGTVLLLAVLTAASYATDARLVHLEGVGAGHAKSVDVEVTAQQWWWQVRYLDSDPSRTFITGNEIHIPIGLPVTLTLRSPDVIHSFWAPDLNGKQDVIPGRDNMMTIQVDEPGVYRGQCAEYCGIQHAHMVFLVVAEEPEAFEAWRAAQLAPAAEPKTDEERQGHDVFLSSACTMCHGIRGTQAAGRLAPDLTHLASRGTIAAGVLPYSRGSLAAWIADPQTIKPGNHMPNVTLSPGDLQSLLAYLDSLK